MIESEVTTVDSRATTRVLLLVEDNVGDAELILELLEESGGEEFEVRHVTRMADAVNRLEEGSVDIVLLDLSLPDMNGVESVRAVKSTAQDTPIVVLTGTEDEDVALSCIDAGAQDYLCKGEIRPIALRRAIGYALTRLREAQLRELRETLKKYRELSSDTMQTSVAAHMAGAGPIQRRSPATFEAMVGAYRELLELYIDQLVLRRPKPLTEMEVIVTQLGDNGAGPRDLLDVHVAALDQAVEAKRDNRARAIVVEGRLLALEMMGMLVDYYRVGLRRRQAD